MPSPPGSHRGPGCAAPQPRGALAGPLRRVSILNVHTRRRSWVTRSAGLAVVLLLTAGCADQPDTEDVASTGSAGSSTAAQEVATGTSASAEPPADAVELPADTVEFPADTATDTADPVDADGLTVTAVRAARHEGYDRVVFELSGSGTPGWEVEYVDAPTSQGTGDPVDVPGQAFLQVSLQGTTYPYESGADEIARGAVPVSGTETVQSVVYDATFEGTSLAWIGTGARTPFRVYSLTGPSRVVVEVVDAG